MDSASHSAATSNDLAQGVQPAPLCGHKQRRVRDGVVGMAVVILVTALGIIFDGYEHFYELTRLLEDWQIDELLAVLLSTSLMTVWYTWRRRNDLQDEIAFRQQVETELRTSEARYRALVDGSLQGMCIHQNTVIRFANRPLATLLDYASPAPLIGQELGQFMTAHDPTPIPHPSRTMRDHRVTTAQQEWQVRRRDGTLRWLESRQVPIQWDGESARLMTVLDITERKQQDYVQQQLAYELHDGLAQLLISAKYRLEALHALSQPQTPQLHTLLTQCLASLDQAILETRRLMARLRPVLVETLGFLPAVQHYLQEMADETGWQVDYQANIGGLVLSETHETALFRIIQEALNNARKHANTSRVAVRLWRQEPPENLGVVCIQDWGQGYDVNNLVLGLQHFGLRSMRERASLLGGTCQIESQPGQGTTVTVHFPLSAYIKEERHES